MDVLEHCARALHRRDVDDPACEPDQRDWDRLTVKFQDEYRADARAVLDAANYRGAVEAMDEAITTLGVLRGYVEFDTEPYHAINAAQRSLLQARER